MSLIQEIKTAQVQARKNRDSEAASTLTTLIGEAEAVGKNAGNRAPTDQEVVALVKKFIKNIDETLGVLQAGSVKFNSYESEKTLLSTFLPRQLDAEALRKVIYAEVQGLPEKNPKAMGQIMAKLKAQFEGQYDGQLASKIAKELLA